VKSYLIDELTPQEIKKIKNSLKKMGLHSPIKDIFWFEVPEDILTSIQKKHLPSCGPFIFSLEIGDSWLKLELLIRATGKIRCSCISYANEVQRNYIIDVLEEIVSPDSSKTLN